MSNRFLLSYTCALLSASACLSAWASTDPSASVGEVTFVIGASRLIDAKGNVAPIVRGMQIRPSDRIETGDSGHTMVRFVDGGSISVRPNSRLAVDTYRYDPANPKDSAVKFQLEEGMARSITGKAGEAAKDKFRLNTPIAAIGVKGTDFIVSANIERVRVAVQSGAVVVSPFDAGCRVDGTGPCANGSARTLSADMGAMMLEIQRQHQIPTMLPAIGSEFARQGRTEVPIARPVVTDTPVVARLPDSTTEARAAITVATLTANESAKPPLPPPPVETPSVEEPPVVVAPPPAPTPAPPVVEPPKVDPPVVITPEPPVVVVVAPSPPPSTPPAPATMVWGRWSWAAALPGTIAVAYDEASQDRKVTVANSTYGLFRPEPAGLPVFPSHLGQVEFNLRDAEAQYVKAGITSPASVAEGLLSVDFGAARFSTALALQHESTGVVGLQASGTIRDDGIFATSTANGKVSGALTFDGKEAGYLFERNAAGGVFQGLTRWMR